MASTMVHRVKGLGIEHGLGVSYAGLGVLYVEGKMYTVEVGVS